MKTLSSTERRALRARAHALHPVVMIGHAGLTPAVLHEIDVNLIAHELIKVRALSDDRAAREAWLAEICDALDSAPVQHLGKLLVIYRERPADEKTEKPAREKRVRPPRAEKPAPRAPLAPRQRLAPRPPRERQASREARAPRATGLREPTGKAGGRPPAAGGSRRRVRGG